MRVGWQAACGKTRRDVEQCGYVGKIGLNLENLRADVGVQAGKTQLGIRLEQRERRAFVARMDAELRIVAAGAHEGVRVCFDADVETEQYGGATSVACERCEALQLLDAVDGDGADATVAGGLQLVGGFSRAVQREPLGIDTCALRRDDLAQRTDVNPDIAAR